ncbi:MAG: hypothetical protein MI747_00875, partial [Desulfobacterales bacterium]|nr:hypothetical protein [Desulfobacterales bacterium]
PLYLGLRQWAREKNQDIPWWQVAMMYGCFVSFCLVVAGGMTLAGEYETRAGLYFIGFLGTAHVVVAALMGRFFVFQTRK